MISTILGLIIILMVIVVILVSCKLTFDIIDDIAENEKRIDDMEVIVSSNSNYNSITSRLKLMLDEEDIVAKINSITDALIRDHMDLYLISNGNAANPDKFITSEESDKLQKLILRMMKDNMSNEMIALWSLILTKTEDNDTIENYLKNRIFLIVTATVVDNNKPI